MLKRTARLILAGTAALAIGATTPAHAEPIEARLMRYPDISGQRIAFVLGDKLWVANNDGGDARQIATPGSAISHLAFSPDGNLIAFTAKVGDNFDVYVVPVDGSTAARRLTHHPAVDKVVDWRPDGKAVLFASTMTSSRAVFDQLHTVSVDGGLPDRLPLPYGEAAAYSADGESLLFTYLDDFQEEAWKRYYGGRAPDLWRLDFATGTTVRLTGHAASDSMPMVMTGGDTYFLSERDEAGRSNIWRLGVDGAPDTPVTHYGTSDVRRPATDGARIVFELDGNLVLFDPRSSVARTIPVTVDSTATGPATRTVKVGEKITSATLTPDGAILEARGDLFAWNAADKAARNLSTSPAAAERFPRANSRGDVAYVSDADGEYALYVRRADGSAPRKIADFGVGLRYNPFWSPDGLRIAIFDHEQVLWLVDVASGAKQRIDQGKWAYHPDMVEANVSWSPDSRWFSWSRGLDNRNNAVFVYDTKSGTRSQLTSGAFDDFAPVFDPTGNFLLMLSHRRFAPTFGDLAFDATWTYTNGTVVSIIPLRAGQIAPGAAGWTASTAQQDVAIDLDGAERRLRTLPAKPGVLSGLRAVDGGYVLIRKGDGDEAPNRLERYGFDAAEGQLLQQAPELALADASGARILTRAETQIFLIDAAKGEPAKIDLSDLSVTASIVTEAQQMFNDSWRYARDFYYDPGLHGADWNAVRAHYEPLIPHVTDDEDLVFILREVVGELNGGHVYAAMTGKRLPSEASDIGMLGVDFARDGRGYRIKRIYNAGSRSFDVRSPLDDAALDVREGDYLLAVNGKRLTESADPWEAMTGLADKDVTLTLARGSGRPRDIMVHTLKSERRLRELAWVEANRRKVEAASGGRIGYIYVPDTTTVGQNELMIGYRSQFSKDALLIDARFNTGGALGDRLVELLNRPPLVYFRARNSGDYPLPELAHRGPKAFLTNSWSYSGGDGFPLLFKAAKVGPVIGTRTWGGLIGPGLHLPLINGGFISSPPQRVYGTDGKWSEGNEGVQPDIEVLNDPGELERGVDQQLDTAVRHLLAEAQKLPPVVVPEFQGPDDWNPASRKGK